MTDVGGRPLVEARVRLVADDTGLAKDAATAGGRAGQSAGRAAADALAKGIGDGLKEGQAKAAAAGGDAADAFAKGFTTDAGGKLRDASGRFVKGAGTQIRDGLAGSVTDGVEKGTEEAAQATGLRARFRRLGETAGKAFGDGITDTQADALDSLGDRALIAGTAVAAGVGLAVKEFADFDKAISRAAAGTNTAKDAMGGLEDAALRAGAETAFSATEAADAITELGKAGVSADNILGGGLDASLALAAAGELDVAEAAEIAATAMNQFGLSGRENIAEVADLLAAGAGKAQGSVSDLANALKYVGPVAASVNVPIEETVGVLAQLASQGILSEQAGTSTRGFLASLLGPSQKASETLEALGIEVFDAGGKFVGFAGAAEQLRTALAGMSQEQQEAALLTIFGRETVTAAKIIYQDGAKGVRDWTAAVSDSGFAADQAATLMDNLSGDVERLGGSLETNLVRSGSGANDALRFLVQGAEDAVNAFGALPEELQQGVVVVGALTAGTLLLGGAMAKGAIAVRRMRNDLDDLGIVSEKTQGRLATVARAAGGLTAAAATLTFLPDITRETSQALGSVGDGLQGMSLELAKFAKGADLGAESAKVFGESFDGTDDLIGKTQGLRQAVNELSGAAGALRKDLPFLPSDEALQIQAYGDALADIARTDAPTAALAFQRIAETAGLNATETERLLGLMPAYKTLLTETAQQQVINGEASADAADASTVLAGQLAEAQGSAGGFGKSAGQAAQEAQELADAMAEAAEESEQFSSLFLTSRSAARDFEAAIDDAAAAVKENGRTLDINTEKGRANQAALDAIAEAARANADAILAQTNDQDKYTGALERGRRKFVDAAVQMGVNKKRARELAEQLIDIPTDIDIQTKLKGVAAARDALDGLITRMNSLGRPVQIEVDAPNVREDRRASSSSSGNFNRRYQARGGWVPGRASEVDTEPYMLAQGEFVVRSREATKPRNRAVLEAMNAGEDVTAAGGSLAVSGPVGMVGPDMSELTGLMRTLIAAVREQSARPVMLGGQVVGAFAREAGYTAGVEWA